MKGKQRIQPIILIFTQLYIVKQLFNIRLQTVAMHISHILIKRVLRYIS